MKGKCKCDFCEEKQTFKLKKNWIARTEFANSWRLFRDLQVGKASSRLISHGNFFFYRPNFGSLRGALFGLRAFGNKSPFDF